MIELNSLSKKILNTELILGLFKRWPRFHDSELLKIEMDRGSPGVPPSLSAWLYAFDLTDRLASDGTYAMDHHVVIHFCFNGIENFQQNDFGIQNVIGEVKFTDVSKDGRERLLVHFDSIYGADIRFSCLACTVVSVTPTTASK